MRPARAGAKRDADQVAAGNDRVRGLLDGDGDGFASRRRGIAVVHGVVELLDLDACRIGAFALGESGLRELERGVADVEGEGGIGIFSGGDFLDRVQHKILAGLFIVWGPFQCLGIPISDSSALPSFAADEARAMDVSPKDRVKKSRRSFVRGVSGRAFNALSYFP